MKNLYNSKAITLIELLIAISLLAMIGVTAATVELSMRKLNVGTDIKVELMNDLVFIKERIKKEAMFATGNATGTIYPFVVVEEGHYVSLQIRNDTESNGLFDGTSLDSVTEFYWVKPNPSSVPLTAMRAYDLYFFPNNGTHSDATAQHIAANVTVFTPEYIAGQRRVTAYIENSRNPPATEDQISNPSGRLRFGVTARQCPPFS